METCRKLSPLERFTKNQGLAYRVIRLLEHRCPEALREDFEQTGLTTLWECCLKYDESRGAAFSTYATAWVTGQLHCFLRTVRRHAKVSTVGYLATCRFATASEEQDTWFDSLTERQRELALLRGEGKTAEEIADELGCSTKEILIELKELRSAIRLSLSSGE